jgi:hypothetical protein
MKFIYSILLFGILAQSTFAVDQKLGCVFPNVGDQTIIENCVEKLKDGSFKFQKSILKKIKFDPQGLAGGSIVGGSCYWLNKKGTLIRSHCFDNGADNFIEGLSRHVDTKGLFGFIDQKFNIKILPKYTYAYPFEYGFAKVCMGCKEQKSKNSNQSKIKGGQWMVIDKTGKVVKQCQGAKEEYQCDVPTN